MKLHIFISSVQKEFTNERATLKEYLTSDPLLRRFCDVFIFEDVPAKGIGAEELYLKEVARTDVYIGLFGRDYGFEGTDGLSPTHREYIRAVELNKHRLIFVKGDASETRHPKMAALIDEASSVIVRRRFSTIAELIGGVYASLVEYLTDTGTLRFGPFDADICEGANFEDISLEKVRWFLNRARDARNFPLDASAEAEPVLSHLRLIRKGKLTNAAVLLFAKEPQHFLYTSEIKCAHFHGTAIQKPIPFYQVYKGNLFELVDQAVNFVLSKIDLAVGTRAKGPQAPVAYEIPPEVISEAIVNAVAHRDYTSTASIQVMLFSDRLEVWNPGTLTTALKLESLREPHGSYPPNPLIAEPLYLTKYIERMGTGIPDMFEKCREYGLPEPEIQLRDGFVAVIHRKQNIAFEKVAGQITVELSGTNGTKLALSRHQVDVLSKCREEVALLDIMAVTGRSDRTKFRHQVLNLLIDLGLIEMTIPDKPRSSKQRYRITKKGLAVLDNL